MSFTVVYDASVLHSAPVRDLLIRLGQTGLFRARWSEQILDEMVASIVRHRPELAGKLERTRELMCEAVRDCLVTGYEPLIEGLHLPDAGDRHVLAAAIRAGAQVVVTDNVRHFPPSDLEPFGIEAQTADVFVLYVIDLAHASVVQVLEQQAGALSDPPMPVSRLLTVLERARLEESVAVLRTMMSER